MTRPLALAILSAILLLLVGFQVGRAASLRSTNGPAVQSRAATEPTVTPPGATGPTATAPGLTPSPTAVARHAAVRPSGSLWHRSASSWFGPNLYGNRTACGLTLTRTLVGVASRTLPCGTLVVFRAHGVTVTAPVVDWGPAAWTGRLWDLTAALCRQLAHCYTAPIDWRLA